MDLEKFEILAIEYLSETLDAGERADFEELLQNRTEYREIFDGMQETWQGIDSIEMPAPSEKMDRGFYAMLHKETKKTQRSDSG